MPSMQTSPLPILPTGPRKRTSSFSLPALPAKVARTMHRTTSHASLAALENTSRAARYLASAPHDCSALVPPHRSLRFQKEQRDRRRTLLQRSCSPAAPAPAPLFAPPPVPSLGVRMSPPRPRASSPLAPRRTPLPDRASFPRSRPEPSLFRAAIAARMRCSPAGQHILRMGPRLAVSMLTATRELERIVAAQRDRADDAPAPLGTSWVVVPGEDWEMVDIDAAP